jgi:hypothetical protein
MPADTIDGAATGRRVLCRTCGSARFDRGCEVGSALGGGERGLWEPTAALAALAALAAVAAAAGAARRAGLEVVEKVLTAAWLVPQELAECLWPAGVSR